MDNGRRGQEIPKDSQYHTAVSSEAWAKLSDWARVAGRGRLLLLGSVAHASLKTAVQPKVAKIFCPNVNAD